MGDSLPKHILTLSDNEEFDKTTIENGFRINELWMTGDATVHEVRQIDKISQERKWQLTELKQNK